MNRNRTMGRVLAGAAAGMALALGLAAGAAGKPDPKGVLATMKKVADWQLANPSKHKPTDWTQGALYAGMMALSYLDGGQPYRDAMKRMGEGNQWQLGPRVYHADDHCVGQTYLELFFKSGESAWIGPTRERFDFIMANPKDADLEFKKPKATDKWSWCDALFMAPPAWTRMFVATKDRKYLDFMNKLWWQTSDYLYDKEEHLYFRDSTYFAKREANGKKVFWSRGNGWVMGGLVRVLQLMPENFPDRARYVRQYKEMAAKILACQQDDGLWRSSLLDPASYPLRETSGSGFYCYALAWGVNQGLLDRATYEPAVLKAWAGLTACVAEDGRLTHVQPIGADPKKFDENATEVYGVGAFLLAGSEVYRLAGGEAPASVYPPVPALTSAGCGDAPASAAVFCAAPLEPPADMPKPAPGAKAYGRHVPERKDDIAWENDRIAFRLYGPALAKDPEPTGSGVDVWSKRTRNLVVNNWYKINNYHNDNGEGLDNYKVGTGRGCGGLGVWKNGKLFVSGVWSSYKFLENGPDRVSFTVDYAPWDAAGTTVSESRRITLEAGSNLNRMESTLKTDAGGELLVGIGLYDHTGKGATWSDKGAGILAAWEPADPKHGTLACGVVVDPKSLVEIRKVGKDTLAIVRVKANAPFVYYAGAGWSKFDFPDVEAWKTYLKEFAAKAKW